MLAFTSPSPFFPLTSFKSAAPPAANRSSFTPLINHVLPPTPQTPRRHISRSKILIQSLFSNNGKSSSRHTKKSILVFGGGSTLGTEIVRQFTSSGEWRVFTLDFYDASIECGGVNGCAIPELEDTTKPISLALPAGAPAKMQVEIARKCLSSSCAEKFDVIINTTLGFSPASLRDSSLFDTCEYMYRTSVESSLVTACLASDFLKDNNPSSNLLVFLGSVAALPGTKSKSLLGFGAAKASVHQIVRLLSGTVGDDLPSNTNVIAIVPEVLDTPLHRSMNDGETGENWTPCDVIASKIFEWATDVDNSPSNGSLVSVSTSSSTNHEDDNHKGDTDNPSIPQSSHKFRLIQDSSYVQPTAL